jgi:hypothetical protein
MDTFCYKQESTFCYKQESMNLFGVEYQTDEDNEDEEEPIGIDIQAIPSPLSASKLAELLLTFPSSYQCDLRELYLRVRHFVAREIIN